MKFIVWISKTLFQTVLISSLTLFIVWFMVNLYVDRLMGQFDGENTLPKVQISDVLSYFVNQENLTNINSEDKGNSSLEEFINEHEKQNSEPTQDNIYDDYTDVEESDDIDAVEVWNQQEYSIEEQGLAPEEVLFTAEAFTSTKDLLSDEDKMTIFSLIISNLPSGELQKLSTIMEEGVTVNELLEIEATMKEHLSEEEYQQMLTILEKY
ncbi:hypothetical protein [Chengkuizengella axinellae]|uniref:Uncharacterized protein n=1 Tax=Chengkuizengella axinellae TaxID=3064388 RepID=A0ABT9J364_9BACL|nr:hypothetical protein [Chengkuizengella sp. 2205SS18-9]MDP5276055.1 hypothetical protein [Chengkuizengella sp. 2205SS18-9]